MFSLLFLAWSKKPKFERELPFIPVFVSEGGIENYFDSFYSNTKMKEQYNKILRESIENIRDSTKNITESVKKLKILEKDENNKDAAFILGVMNEFGVRVPANDSIAFYYYKKASDYGNMEANYRISLFYRFGFGNCEKSPAKASTYLQIAAEDNCVSALMSIAQKYKTHNTVPQSIAMAYHTLQKVAGSLQNNFTADRVFAGNIEVKKLNLDNWPKDKTKKKYAYDAFYNNMINKGDPGATFKTAMANLFNYPANYTKALELFKKAAEEGVVFANGFLGLMYSQGKGTKADIPKAIDYLKKGLAKGDPISAVEIGLICLNSPNADEKLNGKMLIEKAVEGKSPRAIGELGMLYLAGKPPFDEDIKKAMKLFNQAAKLGYLPAYLYRAQVLFSGVYSLKQGHAFNDLMHFVEHSFLFTDSDKAYDAVALHDYHYAIRMYTGLGDMGSNTAIANINLIYKKLGKAKEAKPWLDLLVLNRYNEALLEIGEQQLNSGDVIQGTETIRSAASKNSRAEFILAWEDRYNPVSALKFIDSAVAKNPSCVVAAFVYRVAIISINIPRFLYSSTSRELIEYMFTEYYTTFLLIGSSIVLYILLGKRIERIINSQVF